MSLATVTRSLLIAVVIAGSAWAGDDLSSHPPAKPSSLAPRPRAWHNAYGAPIQAPIVGRKAAHSKKVPAKPVSGNKSHHAPTRRSELDEPF
jgi:hypothetical protein